MREAEVSSKPGAGKVLVRFLASPVNPADINQVQGVYPIKPPLPAIGGNEMVGEIEEVSCSVKARIDARFIIMYCLAPVCVTLSQWRLVQVGMCRMQFPASPCIGEAGS